MGATSGAFAALGLALQPAALAPTHSPLPLRPPPVDSSAARSLGLVASGPDFLLQMGPPGKGFMTLPSASTSPTSRARPSGSTRKSPYLPHRNACPALHRKK